MLPVLVTEQGGGALISAAIGAISAVVAAILSGFAAYLITVRKIGAELAIARENARSLLEAAERQARATVTAACEQADATRQAGFRNSIETEAMKLRFQIIERHLKGFQDRAEDTLACLSEMPGNKPDTKRLSDGIPHVQIVAILEAQQVTRREDLEKLSGAAQALHSACAKLKDALQRTDFDPPPASDHWKTMERGRQTAIAALAHLIAVVNVSSVRRAQGTADDDESLLNALASRWDENVKTLKDTGLWAGD